MCSCLFSCFSYFFPCCCESNKVQKIEDKGRLIADKITTILTNTEQMSNEALSSIITSILGAIEEVGDIADNNIVRDTLRAVITDQSRARDHLIVYVIPILLARGIPIAPFVTTDEQIDINIGLAENEIRRIGPKNTNSC